MRTKYKYISLLLGASAIFGSGDALGQEVKILNISTGSTEGNIKAEIVNAEGATVTGVTARKFRMSTGESSARAEFDVIDGRYISANVDAAPGNDNFYRLEVTFDNGTSFTTDCFNSGMTEGAVWLSELPFTKSNNMEVAFDATADGRPIQIHQNSYFNKGISFRNSDQNTSGMSTITFNTNRKNQYGQKFTYIKFVMGMQAYGVNADGGQVNSGGRARQEVWLNGSKSQSCATFFAFSNPSRGGNVYFFDRTETNTAHVNGLYDVTIKAQNFNTNWADNISNLGAIRLYYPVPEPQTQPQTITFDSPGGIILKAAPEVELSAYASGQTPVFYSIIQGRDLAVIDGNVLKPLQGKSGEVVVEALTFGNETYGLASATQSYTFNFGPTIEFLGTYSPSNNPTDQFLHFYIEPQDRQIEKLEVELYDNVRSFQKIRTVDFLATGLEKYATPLEHVYAIPVKSSDGSNIVHRLTYKFSDGDEFVGKLFDGEEPYVYMTDLPRGSISVGWGQPYYDMAYDAPSNGNKLGNSQYTYAKGYGIHGPGHVETPTSLDLSQFNRFRVDVGGQRISNTTRGKVGFSLYNGVSQPYLSTGNVAWDNVYEWDFPLASTGAGKTVKIGITNGGDGNTNDVVCIGAPRFYYIHESGLAQTLNWKEEEIVNSYTTIKIPLTAEATSNLKPIYRVLSGGANGRIVDNAYLELTLPKEDFDEIEVVVEAYQPGDKEYAPSGSTSCRFRLRRSVVIQKNERLELMGGHDIDELVIFADGKSCGQAVVKDGIINVDKLVLKYSFTPNEWHHIAFPTDLNLAEVSDFSAKGFTYSVNGTSEGTYLVREYDTYGRSDDPESSPWVSLAAPVVEAQKGYIIKLNGGGDTPVEITFEMHNVALDFESAIRGLRVSVDMSACTPEANHALYIRPKNVRGNTLRVNMRYMPTDVSALPINHEEALKQMRVSHTPVRGGIRLTLPDQSPCRVAIYDKKGKKLLKAVKYVSPMMIDISDLKAGQYLMTVAYGPAYRELLVDL